MNRRRYAIVGLGARSEMYTDAMLDRFRERCEVVALCDTNQTRMDYYNRQFKAKFGVGPFPTYSATDFDRMVRERQPEVMLIFSIDRTHHIYICRTMELGCDAITEKPMTIDVPKCRQILDAVARTGHKLRVTFNYRYSPARTTVKDLLMKGTIGEVKAVHFEWLLDTVHGADYFRRWHRDKRNSGGLMVHKATHHFDLVNWWLDSSPQTVFAFGSLAFYGRANAEARGITKFYPRATDHPNAKDDPFALNLRDGQALQGLYLDAEHEDGYLRDQNVFGDGISIEDTMNVLVRYKNGAQMSYSLSAYCPWEGYRIGFVGTQGRLEFDELEASYISAASGEIGQSQSHTQRILVMPHWKKPYEVKPPAPRGPHGGGDVVLVEDVFGEPRPDPYNRFADHIAGARSILTGIAANQSMATGLPVNVDDLISF
jgi:predicted dehydrogenase